MAGRGGGWGEVSDCVKEDRNGPGEQGGALGQEHRAGASPTSRRREPQGADKWGVGWEEGLGQPGAGSAEGTDPRVDIHPHVDLLTRLVQENG